MLVSHVLVLSVGYVRGCLISVVTDGCLFVYRNVEIFGFWICTGAPHKTGSGKTRGIFRVKKPRRFGEYRDLSEVPNRFLSIMQSAREIRARVIRQCHQ